MAEKEHLAKRYRNKMELFWLQLDGAIATTSHGMNGSSLARRRMPILAGFRGSRFLLAWVSLCRKKSSSSAATQLE
jgi:hypothetical protein